MPNKFGWLPDVTDARDYSFDTLLGGPTDLDVGSSLLEFVPGIYSQGRTNSCVLNAIGAALRIVETKAGLPSVGFSRLFGYYNSRRLHGAHRTDRGTYIRTAVKALHRFGVPDETAWPFSSSMFRVNRSPGWPAYMRAHPRRGGTYYRLNGIGFDRVRQVRQALAAGLPVVFGTRIDESFLRNDGPAVVESPTGDFVGGHAMALIGFKWNAVHGWIYLVLNSWGRDWRQGGTVWFTENYLKSVLVRDLTVVVGWERLQRRG